MRKLCLIAVLVGVLSSATFAAEFDPVVLADAEGDGLISKDEFTAYYALMWSFFAAGKSAVDVKQAHPVVRAMILGVIPKAEGTIARDEMLDAVPARYADADKNKDGVVTLDEMKGWSATAMTAPQK
jgi:hypothetical protein